MTKEFINLTESNITVRVDHGVIGTKIYNLFIPKSGYIVYCPEITTQRKEIVDGISLFEEEIEIDGAVMNSKTRSYNFSFFEDKIYIVEEKYKYMFKKALPNIQFVSPNPLKLQNDDDIYVDGFLE